MTTIAELEKTSSAVTAKRFRVEDFRRMTEVGILPEESGWEIIDGYLIDKMTIGSKHASAVNRLNRILTNLVRDSLIVSVQNPIHIDEYNEPEPDIALLRPRKDFYSESHPTPEEVLLLIEISNSTVEYDRTIKKAIYAEAGIGEFWLVNLQDNAIECFSQPKNGNYRLAMILEKGEAVKSGSVKSLELQVDEILGA